MIKITIEKLKTIDADTLLSTPIGKTYFVIDKLLPQGLSVFSGANKIGKSWLVLWLGLMVSKGESIWNLPVNQSDVLYLCLEDTASRLQKRLYDLTDTAPDTFRLATIRNTIGNGLERQIEDFLDDYPNTKLVIIDTFQRVRDSQKSSLKIGMYAGDYCDVTALKAIADSKGVSIVLVHHLRKVHDLIDPFNNVTGSTGITGAADTNFILERDRSNETGKLLVTGRDVEYQELTLRFSNKTHIWSLVEMKNSDDISREKIPDFLFRIVELVKNNGEFKGTSTELLKAVNENETAVNAVTKILARYAFDIFFPENITFKTKRTGTNRLIILTDNSAVQS